MAAMDLSFLRGNPLYILIGFVIFYLFIAQPFFDMDLVKSILLFALIYALYKKYGNNYLDRFKTGSQFGKRRRH